MHLVCAISPEVSTKVAFGVTVIVPDRFGAVQPPFAVTVYGKDPDTVGVPLMVNTPPALMVPVTPAGRSVPIG